MEEQGHACEKIISLPGVEKETETHQSREESQRKSWAVIEEVNKQINSLSELFLSNSDGLSEDGVRGVGFLLAEIAGEIDSYIWHYPDPDETEEIEE